MSLCLGYYATGSHSYQAGGYSAAIPHDREPNYHPKCATAIIFVSRFFVHKRPESSVTNLAIVSTNGSLF